jgi:hypothetical protein
MLDILKNIIPKVPELLREPDNWESLIINKRKPHTYRAFTQLDDIRVCLHKFDMCAQNEAFWHPHPWPGAFLVLSGSYEMKVGYSQDRVSPPKEVLKTILYKGSSYEMLNPLAWHSVVPKSTCYTIMVNGPAWDLDYAHKDIKVTKGKDLKKMSENELDRHLSIFEDLIQEYLESL